MKELFERLSSLVASSYQFPIVLTNIDTKPQIMNVSTQGIQEGYFPLIEYLTDIDIGDTIRTKLENDRIHNSIGEIFKGIDVGKKYIFYKA